MKLLLDTHVLLAAGSASKTLPKQVADRLMDPQNQLYISSVSVWEIFTKYRLDKLPLPEEPRIWLSQITRDLEAIYIPFGIDHAHKLLHLEMHHRDPFDRMLICQANAERLVLVTNDAMIQQYDVLTLW